MGLAPGRAPRHICGAMLAPATESPIAVDRLVKLYKAVTAVDGISFAIAAGSCTALLGGNGAGKTTTIAMIMGLVEPTSGRVTVLGAAMPRQRHRVLHRMNFESPYVNMPMRLTVRQNLNVFGMLYGCEDVAGRIRALADELDLHDFLDRPTGKLSSGQKTRVALAKSLINQPEILLLDEPTASLDPDTADWVRGRLERYRARARRHHPARLAQHGRGRAAVRPRHHDEDRPHRGRRHAGAPARPLRPQQSGRGVPRHRARHRRSAGGGAMSVQSPAHVAFSPRRVGAMVLRYWYLLRSSWPRVLDLIYWPAVQMLMWGFLQHYVSQNSGFFAQAAGTFIGAVMLWDILFRGQLGFSISFLEEMWARNIGNLMMSPLRPVEFVAALMIQSIIRLAIGMVPVSLLAIAFFGFNLWGLGFALAAFFVNLLLTSWAVGILVAGMLLRNGLGAENMAWSIMFLFLPLTCVYYPVDGAARLAAGVRLDAAADLCVRGHARAADRPRVPRRPDGAGVRAQRCAVRRRRWSAFLLLLKSARREGTLLQGGD